MIVRQDFSVSEPSSPTFPIMPHRVPPPQPHSPACAPPCLRVNIHSTEMLRPAPSQEAHPHSSDLESQILRVSTLHPSKQEHSSNSSDLSNLGPYPPNMSQSQVPNPIALISATLPLYSLLVVRDRQGALHTIVRTPAAGGQARDHGNNRHPEGGGARGEVGRGLEEWGGV